MEVKFLDSMVEVRTFDESAMFSWMLFHKDVMQFKMSSVYATAEWDGPSAVNVTVMDCRHKYTQCVDNPIELSTSINSKIDSSSLDYRDYGNYSYVNRNGQLVVAQGSDKITLKVEDDFSATEIDHNTMSIYPDVDPLGIDEDGCFQYILKFKNSGNFRFFYNISNPLDSYFEAE